MAPVDDVILRATIRQEVTRGLDEIIAQLQLLNRTAAATQRQSRRTARDLDNIGDQARQAARRVATLTASLLGLNAAMRGARGLIGGIRGINGQMKLLIGVFATLIPAAVPVFGVVTASVLSMGSAFVSVGVALGVLALGFSGVGDAVSALASGDIDKINEAFANLAPAGQAFARALFDLKPALDLLRGTAQEALLPGVGQALQTLTQILPNLNALVAVFGGALGQVAQQFANAFTSQGFTDFLQFLTTNAGDLNAMADSFIVLSGAVGDLFVAFYPLSAAIGGGALANSFQKFADFASGATGTLGQFLTYVQDALPTVGTFFNLFGSTLLELLEQLGQPGIVVLQALNGILTVITALAPTVGALAQAIGVGLLGVVGALIPVIEQLGPILGDVLIAAATALADTLIALAPTLGQIAAFIGGQLLNAVQTLAPYLPTLGAAFLGVLASLEPLLPLMVSLLPLLGDSLLQVFAALTPAIAALVPAIAAFATAFAGPLAEALVALASPLAALIETLLVPLLEFLADHSDTVTAFAVGIGAVVLAFQAYQTVMTLVTAAQAIFNIVLAANPIGIVVLAIAGLVAGLVYAYNNSETFRNAVQDLWGGIKTLAGSIRDGLGAAIDYVVDKFTKAYDAVKKFLGAAGGVLSGKGASLSDLTFGAFGDTATAHGSGNLATTSASHAAVMGSIGSGVAVSNALIGGGGHGRGSGDHQAGRALDLVGSRTGAYANAARAQGHYAAFHGSGTGRHLHVAFRKPMGDTGTSMAPAAFTTSSTAQQSGETTVAVTVYGNVYADDFYRRVGEAVDEKNRQEQARRKN